MPFRIQPRAIIAALLLFGVAVGVLMAMGRPPICACGTVRLWHGAVHSAENSQHIADWYSFSHVIHGFIFYALAHLLLKGRGRQWGLPLAVAIEGAWEVLENSPAIIDRYREATMALGYSGDSVVNSAADIGWMALGFVFAARVPPWLTVLLAIGFELMMLALIRDNLTLNILMLVWPVESIRLWQGG